MKIAVLSGKGGAGKTLISVNLASILKNVTYIDCDVEEPNGRLFFKPSNVETKQVKVFIPEQIIAKCNGCRKCVDACKFNALALINKKIMVFDEICHSCGACFVACKNEALKSKARDIGIIEKGLHNDIEVISGILNIGESSGVPIIKEMLKNNYRDNIIIDCPPGSACSVIESIKDVDYCILVAEPTIFGVSNLNMIYDLVNILKKKFGVIINKNIEGENIAKEYCTNNNIKILGTINWDLELANITTNGLIATEESNKYKEIFNNILSNIQKEVLL